MKPLRVLYLHMIGSFGGASRSLFEVVRAFPPGEVEASFVTQSGSASAFFARVGEVEESRGMTQFDHTRYSHYRGTRWLVLLRELAYLPFTFAALRRARARWGDFDLIHLNEFTGLVPLWLARRMFCAPAVVHVRSVVHDDLRCRRTLWVHRMLRDEAKAVIAIDQNVRASLPSEMAVEVIHNAFSPNEQPSGYDSIEERLKLLRPSSFKVGFVGNLLRVKGIHELIEAARLTRDRGLDVEFIIVGDDTAPSRGVKARILRTLGLTQNARAEVEAAISLHDLRERMHMLGFTNNIARAYRHMDVLCFPSHYDAPGRPIFEAAYFGVPSIVAVRQPREDTMIHGETGIAVAPHSGDELAAAIERLATDKALAQRMGEAARAMAEQNFNVQRNARHLLGVYRRVVSEAGTRQIQVPATANTP
jgi:glycosyltransferase involved in cell wall biosynthesis